MTATDVCRMLVDWYEGNSPHCAGCDIARIHLEARAVLARELGPVSEVLRDAAKRHPNDIRVMPRREAQNFTLDAEVRPAADTRFAELVRALRKYFGCYKHNWDLCEHQELKRMYGDMCQAWNTTIAPLVADEWNRQLAEEKKP